MKTAKILWCVSSILINVVIGIYIYLQQSGPTDVAERFQYMNEIWPLYGGHWKAELILICMMAIGALFFAFYFKSVSWTIIAVGKLIVLSTYQYMLGGFRNTSIELASMANQMATVAFMFGSFVFYIGLFDLYLKSNILTPWLRYLAVTFSAIFSIGFFMIYLEIITWGQFLIIAPLGNLLYLINAYYGWKIEPLKS